MAIQRRGGYCFIVVSAFSALLQTLGFTVSLHTAFCGDEDDPRFLSGDAWGDHVVLVAHLPCGYYIADVVSQLTVPSVCVAHRHNALKPCPCCSGVFRRFVACIISHCAGRRVLVQDRAS